MKKLIILFTLIFSMGSWASMNQEQTLKVLKGRYQLQAAGETINFVIRSKGSVMMLASSIDYINGDLQFTGSSNSIGPDGLPIANLVFLRWLR